MTQLPLPLKLVATSKELAQPVVVPTSHLGLATGFFEFAGMVNKERRLNQFQYRWGRKVLPKDEVL